MAFNVNYLMKCQLLFSEKKNHQFVVCLICPETDKGYGIMIFVT